MIRSTHRALIAMALASVPMAAGAQPVPAEYQYLYGSGEVAAQSIATFRNLADFAHGKAVLRRKGVPLRQVVLDPASNLETPRFASCGRKPLAAVFDIDETVLLNVGFERWLALGMRSAGVSVAAAWDQWEQTGVEKVAPVPGAVAALKSLRADGITVIFNSNRSTAHAAQTVATLAFAHLAQGRQVLPGVTLFTDPTPASASDHGHKDGRRQKIAQRYCVIAMGGDQLGDFSDLFNTSALLAATPARRAIAQTPAIAPVWGHGWFVMPNSTYGTQVSSHAQADTIFPAPDLAWTYVDQKGAKP